MRQVLTRKGETKRLAEMFGVSCVTVWSALSYRYNSQLCKDIRAKAIERGGRETEWYDNK